MHSSVWPPLLLCFMPYPFCAVRVCLCSTSATCNLRLLGYNLVSICYGCQPLEVTENQRAVQILNSYTYLVLISMLITDESSSLDSLQFRPTTDRELLKPASCDPYLVLSFWQQKRQCTLLATHWYWSRDEHTSISAFSESNWLWILVSCPLNLSSSCVV